MLNLASFFHLNLMYSSIEEDERLAVIQKCYHPLLDLASSEKPISVEATALTLKIIQELDPAWLEKLRQGINNGFVEFVGSGYSQVIAPLVPAKVNIANLKYGFDFYEKILGIQPEIWLVNEMAYSGGLPEIYANAGVKALVMEWNNTWKGHQEWNPQWRHHHQLAQGSDQTTLPVIWVDTLDFQQFQRMAHNDISTDEWLNLWQQKAKTASNQTHFATTYGSDAEVFDFRPGRYSQEKSKRPQDEWKTIDQALIQLANLPGVKLGHLKESLREEPSAVCGQKLSLESTAQPVVVKKQEKYNLNRWAVTGRDDLLINTICQVAVGHLDNDSTDEQWTDLLYRWSSDFRTHLTTKRWEKLQTLPAVRPEPAGLPNEFPGKPFPFSAEDRHLEVNTPSVQAKFDMRRGLALRSVIFPTLGNAAAIGTLPHGYFDDIAFGADFYSGHAVAQHPGHHKVTDLKPCVDKTTLTQLENGNFLLGAEVTDGDLKILKTMEIFTRAPRIVFSGRMDLPERRSGEIHPVHLTIIPGFFDLKNLYFQTHNGGLSLETFSLAESGVHHGESYSTLITAKGGLGATEGLMVISDGNRTLKIQHDRNVSALMPTVRFEKMRDQKYFLRLRYSAQEIDETFVGNSDPWSVQWRVSIEAE
ncbi:MAG: glycoside hydrolase family 57 [bacterium]|nr:glycoside hydrolase family 57 [bacterium]